MIMVMIMIKWAVIMIMIMVIMIMVMIMIRWAVDRPRGGVDQAQGFPDDPSQLGGEEGARDLEWSWDCHRQGLDGEQNSQRFTHLSRVNCEL